jgi:hypothetical protein
MYMRGNPHQSKTPLGRTDRVINVSGATWMCSPITGQVPPSTNLSGFRVNQELSEGRCPAAYGILCSLYERIAVMRFAER